MRRIPTSFLRALGLRPTMRGLRGWLSALILIGACGALLPAAGSASTSAQAGAASTSNGPTANSLAGVTDATTGLPDASSVVARNACGPPSAVRATCLVKILGLRGTRSPVHPLLRSAASPNRLGGLRPRLSRASPLAVPAAQAPQPGTPAYLQQAYDLAYLSQTGGTGATVAIVNAYDAPNAEADLAAYRAKFSLPACTTANGCFSKVDQSGGKNYPSSTSPGWEVETSLDLDAVSALCPNCHIILVEAASDGLSDLAGAQAEAAQLGASVISDSWAVELGRSGAQSFTGSGNYAFPGITTVAASGDDAYLGSTTNYYPAALSNVTAAGGTTLEPASSSGVQTARDFSETAWSGAGSGCVSWVTKPTWQTDTGCHGRAYSDISAVADPATGMQVYDSNDGGWVVVGGTSEAAPLIASYYALLGITGQGPPWAYANSAALNDPSSGSNGTCLITYICNAGAGYDGPTGVGSISGAAATGAPGIGGPGPNKSYTQNVAANTAQLQGGVYPNGADTTYWWEYGETTDYGQTTQATDIGSGNAPVSVTDQLAGLQAGTTYHYRLVAQNGFGTEYGYDFTLTTPPGSANSEGSTGTTTTTGSTPPSTTTSSGATGNTSSSNTGTGSGPTGSISSAPTSPALANLRITAASATTATVSAAVATGGANASYSIQYGGTPALGRSVAGTLGATSISLGGTLGNLVPGQTYYLRVVVTNATGSATSPTIRFRTSPVTIAWLSIRGGRLQVVLRCHGSAPCRVRLQARSGSRLVAAGQAAIRRNRAVTVTLKLSHLAKGSRVKLSVLSSWNGYPAAVTASAR